MKWGLLFSCIAYGLMATYVLHAADEDVLAETETAATFDMYAADGNTYTVGSFAEIALLPAITRRTGERVTLIAPDGTETILAGTTLALDAGGIWTLVNSVQGTARIGVAWSVFNDGGTLATSTPAGYRINTRQEGPDRSKLRPEDALPVAYSGDNWVGDPAKASTLAFIAPNGAETSLDLTGTGVQQFVFGMVGDWTVRLVMADSSVRTAVISIMGGMTCIFR